MFNSLGFNHALWLNAMPRRPGGIAALQTDTDLLQQLQQLHGDQQHQQQNQQHHDPDNTDDSGMGAELPLIDGEEPFELPPLCGNVESELRGVYSSSSEGDSEEAVTDSSDDDLNLTSSNTTIPSRRPSSQGGWGGGRRTSNAGNNDRTRRPSYTCHHGPPLPRGAPRIGRRAKPRPLRDIDVLQLAAGAACMVAPLTPELLR